MDELDRFVLAAPLTDTWKATHVHEIQRDQPNRCRTYHAVHASGRRGFVKVLPPTTHDLELMRRQIDEFFYEKEIVELCAQRNMRRVVRALAFDKLEAPGVVPTTLHYLIFEWGEHDARSLDTASDADYVRAVIKCLHHVATAVMEIHFSNIAHQNLRPASIIRFADDSHKVGDFRHSHRAGVPRTHDSGPPDATYAAPEILYGRPIASFDDRCAIDLYQLGSLGFSLLSGIGATTQMSRRLSALHHWRTWTGSFDDALPFLVIAHEELVRAVGPDLPPSIRPDLVLALRQLTEPDPRRRGHPTNARGSGPRYGVERYVSLFALLLKRLDVNRRRGAA